MPDEESGAQEATSPHHSPEWETKGRKRSSVLDWLKGAVSPIPPRAPEDAPVKESKLTQSPDASAMNMNENTARRPSRLDALFRPDRTYLGLTRDRFVLFIVIPAVTVALIILPVALGVGLSSHRGRRDLSTPSKDDPW